jgi:hypothetical protein
VAILGFALAFVALIPGTNPARAQLKPVLFGRFAHMR